MPEFETSPRPRDSVLVSFPLARHDLNRLDLQVIRERSRRNVRRTSRSDIIRELVEAYLERAEQE